MAITVTLLHASNTGTLSHALSPASTLAPGSELQVVNTTVLHSFNGSCYVLGATVFQHSIDAVRLLGLSHHTTIDNVTLHAQAVINGSDVISAQTSVLLHPTATAAFGPEVLQAASATVGFQAMLSTYPQAAGASATQHHRFCCWIDSTRS